MHTEAEEHAMEATVAERGQITLPKAVRDALGLTKGTLLKVELDGARIILRKNIDDAISRARGRFELGRANSGLCGHGSLSFSEGAARPGW